MLVRLTTCTARRPARRVRSRVFEAGPGRNARCWTPRCRATSSAMARVRGLFGGDHDRGGRSRAGPRCRAWPTRPAREPRRRAGAADGSPPIARVLGARSYKAVRLVPEGQVFDGCRRRSAAMSETAPRLPGWRPSGRSRIRVGRRRRPPRTLKRSPGTSASRPGRGRRSPPRPPWRRSGVVSGRSVGARVTITGFWPGVRRRGHRGWYERGGYPRAQPHRRFCPWAPSTTPPAGARPRASWSTARAAGQVRVPSTLRPTSVAPGASSIGGRQGTRPGRGPRTPSNGRRRAPSPR